MKTDTIRRLIALKTESINQLRQDLYQLEQLVKESRKEHELILVETQDYADGISLQESSGKSLLAIEMIERRRFLASLHLEVSRKKKSVAEVEQQYDYALNNLKQAYMEVKTLDLLAERKAALKLLQDSRKSFTTADDEQTMRHVSVVE